MKRIFTFIALVITVCEARGKVGTWFERASLGFVRTNHVSFALKGKGYLCAGKDQVGDRNDLWQYDPTSNTWSQKANLPGLGRRELSSFVIGNYAYVGHGRNVEQAIIYTSFYKYDPEQNSWSSIADCPVERYSGTGFSIDSTGYVTCGILPGVSRYKDLYAYSPSTNLWEQKASLPANAKARSYPCLVTLNHKAYLMGGFEGGVLSDFYEYDPTSDTWKERASYIGGARNFAAGFALGNRVIMGIGRDNSMNTYHDFYAYSPQSDSWTPMSDFPYANSAGHGTFIINDIAYVVAGNLRDGTPVSNLYALYVPEWLSNYNDIGKGELDVKVSKPFGNGVLLLETAIFLDFTYVVYDLTGKRVMNGISKHNFKVNRAIELDTHLATGVYILVLECSGKRKTLKFLY